MLPLEPDTFPSWPAQVHLSSSRKPWVQQLIRIQTSLCAFTFLGSHRFPTGFKKKTTKKRGLHTWEVAQMWRLIFGLITKTLHSAYWAASLLFRKERRLAVFTPRWDFLFPMEKKQNSSFNFLRATLWKLSLKKRWKASTFLLLTSSGMKSP